MKLPNFLTPKPTLDTIEITPQEIMWLMPLLDDDHCFICKAPLTVQNVGIIFKTDTVHTLCNSPQCLLELRNTTP